MSRTEKRLKPPEVHQPDSESVQGDDPSLSQVLTRTSLHIARATRQMVYDYQGVEYLDCVNGISHVGHCHPKVS